MKRFSKWLLSAVTVVVIIVGAAFYLYLSLLPTSPPRAVNVDELNNQESANEFQCAGDTGFNYAYEVGIHVDSQINGKPVYNSTINFKTQLTQANANIIRGIASDIVIDEGNGAQAVKDIYYLTEIDVNANGAYPQSVFVAFNGLGLPLKHPMAVLTQLLKALSVGQEDELYRFTYDSIARSYRYQQQDNNIQRESVPLVGNLQQLTQSLSVSNSDWSIIQDNSCLPATVHSDESQPITAGQYEGFIRFRLKAKKISPYHTINTQAYSSDANANHIWDAKAIAAAELEQPVLNRDQMLNIFSNYETEKNTATLQQAAEYMLDNIDVTELTDYLSNDELSDNVKRDLIFSLGITDRSEAEGYMLQALNSLSTDNTQSNTDMQKLRLMVAISGNNQVTTEAFNALSDIVTNSEESNNIRTNAMINMGTIVGQLNNKGDSTESIRQTLSDMVSTQIQSGDNAASAIMAAGNAGLTTVNKQISEKLSTGTIKERYASGRVLSRDPDNYDTVIKHLSTEPSRLVTNAIIGNLQPDSLSNAQRATLQQIAATAEPEKAKIIQALLNKS